MIWEEQGRLGLPLSKVGTLKLMTSENEITDEVTIHHQPDSGLSTKHTDATLLFKLKLVI